MKLPGAAQSSAAGDLDFSIVLPNPFESDLDVPVARETRKLLSPLYQENAVFSEQVIESESFQLPGRVDAIQVNVLPAPRSPRSNTSLGGASKSVSVRPKAVVSSAEWVIVSRALAAGTDTQQV
jgi:hypothetical protein